MSSEECWEGVCVAPPAPGGSALIAAADDEADEATLAHLAVCPTCTARVAQLRRFQAQLRRRLYRATCPSSDLLVDYCQGLLDPYQRAAMIHHLALCPHCTAEVELLVRSVAMPESRSIPTTLPASLI
ncbi:MAG: zf-HC2 domain-containing protein [Oscillochloridaceae bacterium umkhey_bin13]